MNKILVGINFETDTEEIINNAQIMAKAFNAKLRLLHVAAPNPDFIGYEPGPQTVRNSRASTLRHEHQQLHDLADRLSDDGIQTDTLLVQGETARTLLAQAREWEADAIMLGNQGHGFVRKALHGSMSEQVLKEASCMIMLVPVPSAAK